MIALRTALEHVAWADDKLFEFLDTLPDDAWRARAAPDEWHVAALAFHLVASADWYRFQLGGQLALTSEPQSIAEVRALRSTWQAINRFLVAECDNDDEMLSYAEDGEAHHVLRSRVLTEVIVHSVEHRAQIAAALKAGGHTPLELEDYSAWAYREAML